MSDGGRKEVASGGRYNRGGYRNKRNHKGMQVGAERLLEKDEPISLDGDLLQGENFGSQDPTAFPREDSDVGGPPVAGEQGGLGVPKISRASEPAFDGDRQRELDQLESEVDNDPQLTPQRSEEDELVETEDEKPEPSQDKEPEPQPTPANLPSDEEAVGELEEEPVEEEKVEGEGITQTQLDEEMGRASESVDQPEEVSDAEEAEQPESEDEDDDIEISTESEDEKADF